MLIKSKLKYIQTLGQKKFRDTEGLFIAEGPKMIDELIHHSHDSIIGIFALPEWTESHPHIKGIDIEELSDDELKKISQQTTPNLVLAIVKQFQVPENPDLKGKFSIVLDAIRDPGNMGTIIRIADWFGIEYIICSEDCADIYNPKVVQSSMGSIMRVKIVQKDLQSWLVAQQIRIYAATIEGKDVRKMEPVQEGLLLIGNESKGISPALMDLANVKVNIPGKGRAESLNAAVATGIVLSHILDR
jgi:TrmH family RNA methyltransferase